MIELHGIDGPPHKVARMPKRVYVPMVKLRRADGSPNDGWRTVSLLTKYEDAQRLVNVFLRHGEQARVVTYTLDRGRRG